MLFPIWRVPTTFCRTNLKTLHRYLLRQVTASVLMTGVVFTGVLLMGNALKDILPLLFTGRATVAIIAKAFALLIPFLWTFALPMGMLTATLLVFGRFSADQELTAARASGVSLLSLVTPILLLSLVFCALCAVVNLEMAPRCRVIYKGLRAGLTSALLKVDLPEDQPITEFKNYVIYVGKNQNRELRKILIYQFQNETNLIIRIRAPRGRIELGANNQILLHLDDVQALYLVGGNQGYAPTTTIPLELDVQEKHQEADITDMTFSELLDRQRELERRVNLPIPRGKLSADDVLAKKRDLKKYRSDITEPIRVQIHRQVAFSFACFGFTLIGIPLGIRVQRRETNVGVAVALGLVAVYYGLIIIGEALTSRPEFAPHLWMWLPNFLFQAIGAVLLWRANRGF